MLVVLAANVFLTALTTIAAQILLAHITTFAKITA